MLYTPSIATRAQRYGAEAFRTRSRWAGSQWEKQTKRTPLALAILAPSWMELWEYSSTTNKSGLPTKSGNSPQVRQSDGRIDQCCFCAQPAGQLVFGIGVGPDAGEGSAGAVVRAPSSYAVPNCLLDARILIESEEAVGPEIGNFVSVDRDPPARPDFVHHQVFQVIGGKLRGKVLEETNQAVLTQSLGQLLHRGVGHVRLAILLRGRAGPAHFNSPRPDVVLPR